MNNPTQTTTDAPAKIDYVILCVGEQWYQSKPPELLGVIDLPERTKYKWGIEKLTELLTSVILAQAGVKPHLIKDGIGSPAKSLRYFEIQLNLIHYKKSTLCKREREIYQRTFELLFTLKS